MKLLFITNMYPTSTHTYFGIHVKEQIDSLKPFIDNDSYTLFINGKKSKFNYLKSIYDVYNAVNNQKIDIIHIHYGLSAFFLLFFKPKVPCIITLHSGELFRKHGRINHIIQKYITLRILNKVNKIIILNDDMHQLLIKHNSKIIKLPCGVNINMFDGNYLLLNKDKIVRIGFPGNKERIEKNYKLFIEIITRLRITHQVEVVEFHNMSREQVISNLKSLDVLLMTSLVEGSPQIIKEAMALNIPIVSSNCGDVQYLLKDVDQCFFIDSLNVDDYLCSIYKILNTPDSKRSNNARQKLIELGLDSNSVTNSLLFTYEAILK